VELVVIPILYPQPIARRQTNEVKAKIAHPAKVILREIAFAPHGEHILQIAPDNLDAMYNKAVGYYYLGEYQVALEEFRSILIKDEENQAVLEAIKELVLKLN